MKIEVMSFNEKISQLSSEIIETANCYSIRFTTCRGKQFDIFFNNERDGIRIRETNGSDPLIILPEVANSIIVK